MSKIEDLILQIKEGNIEKVNNILNSDKFLKSCFGNLDISKDLEDQLIANYIETKTDRTCAKTDIIDEFIKEDKFKIYKNAFKSINDLQGDIHELKSEILHMNIKINEIKLKNDLLYKLKNV